MVSVMVSVTVSVVSVTVSIMVGVMISVMVLVMVGVTESVMESVMVKVNVIVMVVAVSTVATGCTFATHAAEFCFEKNQEKSSRMGTTQIPGSEVRSGALRRQVQVLPTRSTPKHPSTRNWYETFVAQFILVFPVCPTNFAECVAPARAS